MSALTHYESWELLLAPYIPLAQAAVKRDGWMAYPLFTQKLVERTRTVRREMTANDPEALMTAAILQVLVESRMATFKDPNSIEEGMKDEQLNALGNWFVAAFGGIKGELHAGEEFSTMITHLYQRCIHRRTGEHTYEVSPGLAERLVHTEVRGLTTDDVRLPFSNIYIVVPPESGLQVSHIDTGEHVCNGFYITEDLNGTHGRTWRLMALGASKNPGNPWDDALFHFSMTLAPGHDLDEALFKLEEQNSIAETSARSQKSREYYRKTWLPLFRFVLNVVLYITWPDARTEYVVGNPEVKRLMEQMRKHPKGSNKYERAKAQLKGLQQQRRVYLGRGVASLAEVAGSGTQRGPVTVRTLVAGHWKTQPYGPKSALRKTIWREPFWRGPLEAPEAKTVHVL